MSPCHSLTDFNNFIRGPRNVFMVWTSYKYNNLWLFMKVCLVLNVRVRPKWKHFRENYQYCSKIFFQYISIFWQIVAKTNDHSLVLLFLIVLPRNWEEEAVTLKGMRFLTESYTKWKLNWSINCKKSLFQLKWIEMDEAPYWIARISKLTTELKYWKVILQLK